MRLIDADEFVKDLDKCLRYGYNTAMIDKYEVLHRLNNAPTIDAVPVVRCKDCRWGREVCGNIECSVDRNLPPEYHGYEWFCPNGERRTNEVN